ncbi:acyl-CoA transferase/carnitine dehydratase [Phenylobacterium zucineum HLK1]|uniref:Acyl-CoA transferase/carnitine dehydratase n=1 Tax=Phenylobacterium zucineum (strain HLK1) TaxID=450851 RepID=B4RGN1_PHEZH|nr:CoA transferase [Phenylobacterium zucineum]ACG78937.1 acyl-CoA transferase/carnitine dehydratase [Phenylobacterium zucineum HLK1]
MPAPLSNVRVLELGRVFAAPWAGQLLADLGAEVIKVEALDGDPMRQMGLGVVRDAEGRETSDRSVFVAVNRNKKSIAVDLAAEGGAELVRRLAASCDVFIENYKVGDLARRGLDYEAIRAVRPDVIYLSVTGYGQTGPYRERPGMDNIVQGLTGYMSMTGRPGDPPQASPVSIMDFSAGMHGALAVVAALYARSSANAGGQHIDLALLDSGLALVGYKMVATLLSGEEPPRGVRTRGYIPGGAFETADGWFQMTIGADSDWARFCRATERPDLAADPRFADRWLRTDNQEALLADVEAMFRTRPRAHWLKVLNEAGLMAGAVLTLTEAAEDPQVRARDSVLSIRHALGGELPVVRNPIRMTGTPLCEPQSPPLLGQDADEVLGELLGLGPSEVEALRGKGVLGAAPARGAGETG